MLINRIRTKINRTIRLQEERIFGQRIIKNSIYEAPDFMVIGAAKSGTTSLYQYLAQHPNLVPSAEKELQYFGMLRREKGLRWYLSNFPCKGIKDKIFFEATPNYLYRERSPKQIAKLFPQMKFIVILRDPVKRAFSHWNSHHDFSFTENRTELKDERSFEEAIHQEQNDLDNVPLAYRYLAKGTYSTQLERWYQYFPKENILLLEFEELKENVKELLGKVIKFLSIPPVYEDFIEIDKAIIGQVFTKDEENEKEIKRYNITPYKEELNKETEKLLKAYFLPYDKELVVLTGQKFYWMD